MTQKDFYTKHKEFINAYFSGERVEYSFGDRDGWHIAWSDAFFISGWTDPDEIQFRIVNENDMLNDAIKDQLDMDIPKKETPKLPDEWDMSYGTGEFFTETSDGKIRPVKTEDILIKQNLIINYLKAKEGE